MTQAYSSGDVLAGNVSASDPSDREYGTCSYYPTTAEGCMRPRSCYDCLNTPVAGENEGCMVNEVGQCVPISPSTYNESMDFRAAYPANVFAANMTTQMLQFRARDVDYCQYDDPFCHVCKETVFADVIDWISGPQNLTKYCYGENGCVCIAICESPQWINYVHDMGCASTPYYNKYSNEENEKHNGATGLWVGISSAFVVCVLVVMLVVYKRSRRLSQSRSADGGNTVVTGEIHETVAMATRMSQSQVPTAMAVDSYSDEMLMADMEQLSPSNVVYIHFEDGDGAIHNQDETQASAPMMVMPMATASAPEEIIPESSAPIMYSPRTDASAPAFFPQNFGSNTPSAPDFDHL